jgi:hypothetical protein
MPFKGTPSTFTLLGARVTTTSQPTPFGQVASGTLRIQGHLRPVTCLATGADACSNKLWPREVYFPHPWDERAVLLAGANLMQNETGAGQPECPVILALFDCEEDMKMVNFPGVLP